MLISESLSAMRKVFVLSHPEARRRAVSAVIGAPDGMLVEVRPATRSLEQNARMWAMLADVAQQVDWHGRRLTSEEWKDVFSAALRRQTVVPGLDGGFVVLGLRTSKMTKSEMGDLMELISAFGAQHGVKFHG